MYSFLQIVSGLTPLGSDPCAQIDLFVSISEMRQKDIEERTEICRNIQHTFQRKERRVDRSN
jgi:hypothetical protein